jgi:hypothetical protein
MKININKISKEGCMRCDWGGSANFVQEVLAWRHLTFLGVILNTIRVVDKTLIAFLVYEKTLENIFQEQKLLEKYSKILPLSGSLKSQIKILKKSDLDPAFTLLNRDVL